MTFGQFLLTIGLPTFVGAIIIVPAWVLPKFRYTAGIAGSALGVALGLSLVIAFMAEAGVPSLPPLAKWHMLPIIACGLTILCPVAAMVDDSGELGRWVISIAAGAIIGWLAIFPGMDWLLRSLLGLWVGVTFMTLSWVSHRQRGITVTLAITIVFAGLSVLCLEAKFLTLTLISTAMTATCAVGFISALAAVIWTHDKEGKRRYIAIGWGGAFAVATLLPLVAFCGWAYNMGEVQWVHWVLVAGAPMLLGLGELPGLNKIRNMAGFFIRIVVVAIPVAVAVILLATDPKVTTTTTDQGYNLEEFEEPQMP